MSAAVNKGEAASSVAATMKALIADSWTIMHKVNVAKSVD